MPVNVVIPESVIQAFPVQERDSLRKLVTLISEAVDTSIGSLTLNDLSDVVVPSPTENDVLTFTDPDWTAEAGSSGSSWKNIQDVGGITLSYAGGESGYGTTPSVYGNFYSTTSYPSFTDQQTGATGRIVLSGLPQNTNGEGSVRLTILEATNDTVYDFTVGRTTQSGTGSITPTSFVYTYASNTVEIPFRSEAPGNQSSWKALILLEVYT